MPFETIKLALRTIYRNFLRSFLTVLGVIIGVAAVIAMVTIGNGTTESVKKKLSGLGTNTLYIYKGKNTGRENGSVPKNFTEQDVEAISTQISGLDAVAPVNSASVTAVYGGENYQTGAWGTNNQILIVQDWKIALGRSFLPAEDTGGSIACILGETVRRQLFGTGNPIGQSVRLDQVSCPVVGVLAKKGQSGMGRDQDDVVFMPLSIHQRRFGGIKTVDDILVAVRDGVSSKKTTKKIEKLIRERRNITNEEDDDFTVNDMAQVTEAMTRTNKLMTKLLGAVASVSLLVGGIGIMNIMLVSVTERTREIGIRLAIGALERQVLMQFLTEAILLSTLGGLVGIILGIGIAYGTVIYLKVPFMLSIPVILVSFGFSAAIGIIFGYFPAKRAASLSPIDALRHE